MIIKLNSKIYPLEAIINTSYAFVDRGYIFLDTDAKGSQVNVSIKTKHCSSVKELESLRGEFMNELLHSALRYTVSKNNKKIREYIIGRALYSVLPYSELSAADIPNHDGKFDYQKDPLGIAVPWKKKHAKNKKIVRAKAR